MTKHFKIKITETGQEPRIIGGRWEKGAGETPEDYGYTPQTEAMCDYERVVFAQKTDHLDLRHVIAAVNNLRTLEAAAFDRAPATACDLGHIRELDKAASPGPWNDDTVATIPAGSRRVALGNPPAPPPAPIRILSEENWQLAAALVNAWRAGKLRA